MGSWPAAAAPARQQIRDLQLQLGKRNDDRDHDHDYDRDLDHNHDRNYGHDHHLETADAMSDAMGKAIFTIRVERSAACRPLMDTGTSACMY